MIPASLEGGAPAAAGHPGAGRVYSRIYAIGDIHGRLDLLRRLQQIIARDAASLPKSVQPTVVYLGDYVDRGPDSAGVIEELLQRPLAGFRSIYLLGNHEALLLDFLTRAEVAPLWFRNGGLETLQSYGVECAPAALGALEPDAIAAAQTRLRKRLPRGHLKFLKSLRPHYSSRRYLFVHAGLRPGRALGAQSRQDLLWIRDPFLASEADHGKVVVHGHTITPQVEIRPNRIGVDTGAYETGVLSAVALDRTGVRVLEAKA